MRCRRAIVSWATAVLAALATLGCGDDPAASGTGPGPMGVGAPLDLSLALPDARRELRPVALRRLAGRRATVLLAWSVPCPCVEAVEARVQALMRRYGPAQGVGWVAVDGEPHDTVERVREKLLRLDAPYPLLLDPGQALCTRLGFTAATQVAILDGEGRLAYRGALDADLAVGRGEHVATVLDALLRGRPLPFVERPHVYGCDFGDPAHGARLR